jgi:hypothetical protein
LTQKKLRSDIYVFDNALCMHIVIDGEVMQLYFNLAACKMWRWSDRLVACAALCQR